MWRSSRDFRELQFFNLWYDPACVAAQQFRKKTTFVKKIKRIKNNKIPNEFLQNYQHEIYNQWNSQSLHSGETRPKTITPPVSRGDSISYTWHGYNSIKLCYQNEKQQKETHIK